MPVIAVFHGIIIVMFFQCLSALLDPTRRGERGVKWPLVAHTTAMFSFVTVSVVANFYVQIIAFIDNRNFPGIDWYPPGPTGYLLLTGSEAVVVVSSAPMILNGWLADGLLLYRCFVIYAGSYWVIAFPCLMYFASFGLGIVYIFQSSHSLDSYWMTSAFNFGVLYFSISLSLNILLTSMIVGRLILHNRSIRNMVGASSTFGGLTSFVNVILVESCALCGVGSALLIGAWSAESYLTEYFSWVFVATQVIAPFLIILRVANRTALTSKTISMSIGSLHFRGERSMDSGGAPPETSLDGRREAPGGVCVEAENAIEEVPL